MTKGKRTEHVPADEERAGKNWWLDDYAKEEMHKRIFALLRDGVSKREIARLTGVSDRSVGRITTRKRGTAMINRCGAPRESDGEPCTVWVRNPGDVCRHHRDS